MNTNIAPTPTDSAGAPPDITEKTAASRPVKKNKPAPAVRAASPSKTRTVSPVSIPKSKTAAARGASKAPKAAKPVAQRPAKVQKVKAKLVRDSFTMPQTDFDLIDMLKQRALDFRHSAKKSELLRAGLQVLAALPHAQLQAALEHITPLKPGRPKKSD